MVWRIWRESHRHTPNILAMSIALAKHRAYRKDERGSSKPDEVDTLPALPGERLRNFVE